MSFIFSQPTPGILPANSVDFSEVETIGANTLLGNNTGADSVIQELSVASVSTMLNLSQYLTSVSGTAPIVSSGGTTPVISINNFGGATALLPGSKGSVPAPAAGDEGKYLKGDATWAIVDLSTKADTNLGNLANPTALNQVLRGQNGTVTAPAYSFTNSTNSGMYYNSATYLCYNGGNGLAVAGADVYIYKNLNLQGVTLYTNGGSAFLGPTYISSLNWSSDNTSYVTSATVPAIGRGWTGVLYRPYRTDVAQKITIGKKISGNKIYGATLAVNGTDPLTSNSVTTNNPNNSTTIIANNGDPSGANIDVGDIIYLSGESPAREARITDLTIAYPNVTYTVDSPLGDGTNRTIVYKEHIASFRKSDTTEVFLIKNNGVLKSGSGEQHASIHNQAGTADVITASINDYYIGVDTSSAAKTVNLPAAATAGQGFVLVIKDESGNAATAGRNITIDANGSETIDGALTQVINTNYGSVSLMCSGSAWFLM
jgi:hypothetical protein